MICCLNLRFNFWSGFVDVTSIDWFYCLWSFITVVSCPVVTSKTAWRTQAFLITWCAPWTMTADKSIVLWSSHKCPQASVRIFCWLQGFTWINVLRMIKFKPEASLVCNNIKLMTLIGNSSSKVVKICPKIMPDLTHWIVTKWDVYAWFL